MSIVRGFLQKKELKPKQKYEDPQNHKRQRIQKDKRNCW